ncbi:MAG: hypothetical protein K8S54_04265 [Spirochaetia bacterium]|nr:hypothetical protein [Spirochaetia bacterium]
MNKKRLPIILKAGREKSLKHRHPLVFSGAIETWPECADGDILIVRSKGGEYQSQCASACLWKGMPGA